MKISEHDDYPKRAPANDHPESQPRPEAPASQPEAGWNHELFVLHSLQDEFTNRISRIQDRLSRVIDTSIADAAQPAEEPDELDELAPEGAGDWLDSENPYS